MKVIYICGPYRGHRLANILRARSAALFVWRCGGVALCPHLNTAFFDRHAPDETWLSGDLALMARCDAVWAIGGWRESEGARRELAEAERMGIPRLFSRQDAEWFCRVRQARGASGMIAGT